MSKKTYGKIAIISCLITCMINILVVAQVIPFSLIGGGNLQFYKDAVLMATLSTVIQLLLIICIVASSIVKTQSITKISNAILYFFTVYLCINLILNLLGITWFEKIVSSFICLIQIFCFIKIRICKGENYYAN